MNLTAQTCTEFLDALASKAPVPGGGGASALVGAVGVALGNMVGNLTVGKKKYASVEADVIALDQKAGALRRRLLDMGIVEGTRVECLGMSPGGDPKAFLVRGAVLAIRGQDCRDIMIYP